MLKLVRKKILMRWFIFYILKYLDNIRYEKTLERKINEKKNTKIIFNFWKILEKNIIKNKNKIIIFFLFKYY